MIVPERPEDLLVEFLPRYFAELAAPVDPEPRVGVQTDGSRAARRLPAPVGVAMRIVSAGEWTLRIVSGHLQVAAGVAPDVALQLSMHARDFSALVVGPLRQAERALATSRSPGTSTERTSERPLAAKAASSGVWSRLGRWDEETVDLLRRQAGRILVRVDDAGTSRNVAITPGLLPYSLETAECIIDCRLADLEGLQTKKANPLDLFYQGQIRITGDAQVALAMAGLFL